MQLPARNRRRVSIAIAFCLLMQQAALAAYFCPMEGAPAVTTAMAEACEETGMQAGSPALCQLHCADDASGTADQAKVLVFTAVLPAILFELSATPAVVRVPSPSAAFASKDPPPRLRYCSLLI